jgi:serine/threonine protein kinase
MDVAMSQTRVIGGRFEIGALIGEGGMGEVYHGLDIQTGQAVAIKTIRLALVASPGLVERFAREGEALRQLNHPNIVKVLATPEQAGQRYIVTEYVDGGSLRELLDAGPQLPVERTLEIALELADALTRAHHLGIIHRDVKPANVLLAEDGTPYLTDFGLARVGESNITETGAFVGTIAYLSPEACKGKVLDERTDIWAFGTMLFEMLAGQLPFEEDNLGAAIMAILT